VWRLLQRALRGRSPAPAGNRALSDESSAGQDQQFAAARPAGYYLRLPYGDVVHPENLSLRHHGRGLVPVLVPKILDLGLAGVVGVTVVRLFDHVLSALPEDVTLQGTFSWDLVKPLVALVMAGAFTGTAWAVRGSMARWVGRIGEVAQPDAVPHGSHSDGPPDGKK
jgi:hypothetical protein